MASPTESSPLLLGGHPTQPLEVRAAELIAQGASSSGIILPPPPLDLTHEFASSLYALHIVERHDRARGSARAAAFRASESARTRAALRDHALASLDAALEYVGLPDDDKDDEDDDDVLVMSRPLPVKRRCTTGEFVLSRFEGGAGRVEVVKLANGSRCSPRTSHYARSSASTPTDPSCAPSRMV